MEELRHRLDELKRELIPLQSPVVFCHNDLLCRNLILNPKMDRVHFIDFEYAESNFQAFDISNHFCEWSGVENVDFSRYPDRELQIPWLTNYLQFWHQESKLAPPSESDVERLYVQVNKFAMVNEIF